MSFRSKVLVFSCIALFVLWLIVIPAVWTCLVHNKIGTSGSGGLFIVDVVNPSPWYGWVYGDHWIVDNPSRVLSNGATFWSARPHFPGYCSVFDFTFNK